MVRVRCAQHGVPFFFVFDQPTLFRDQITKVDTRDRSQFDGCASFEFGWNTQRDRNGEDMAIDTHCFETGFILLSRHVRGERGERANCEAFQITRLAFV
jgi:hypothetical protein